MTIASNHLSLHDYSQEDGVTSFTLTANRSRYFYVITGYKDGEDFPRDVRLVVFCGRQRREVRYDKVRFELLNDQVISATECLDFYNPEREAALNRIDNAAKERRS